MTPLLRKFFLTTHITASVGWLGAIAAFVALSVIGLANKDATTIRSAYLAMDLIGWSVIVPLSFAALGTGLIQTLTTPWGLLRHYWVLSKLLVTVLAAGLLLLHQYTAVGAAAERVAGAVAGTLPSAGRLGPQLVMDASLAILALTTAVALAIYKPRGMTALGRRWQLARGPEVSSGIASGSPSLGLWIFLAVAAAVAVVFGFVHVTGMTAHG